MEETVNSNDDYLNKKVGIQEIILDYHEYFLLNENIIYKIIIIKYKDKIMIKTKNYSIEFDTNQLLLLTKVQFNNIDDAYNFIINIFNENKVKIDNEIINKSIQLILTIENEKKLEVDLLFNKEKDNENIILNKIYNMQNEINKLKEENKKLIKEINILKKYHDVNNPKDIEFLSDLSSNPNSYINLDNSFTIFKSINGILYLIHSNIEQSIISYDLNNLKKVVELKNTHMRPISNFRHYFDEINKRDLVMTISCDDNNIKIWDATNWVCLIDIKDINKEGDLYFACFLKEKNNNYIVTSNRNRNGDSERIKIFDFNGKIIKEINNSNENTLFIDSYYDKKLSKNYIITANFGHVKSYDYDKNILYHKYSDNDNERGHYSVIIKNYENIVKLYESCTDGHLRIWNFHAGLLLKKIKVSDGGLRGICLWDDNNLFVGSDDRTIKLVDIKNEFITKNLDGHNNKVISLKKIIHPKFGECLISQAFKKDKIKLWKNKNNYYNL